MCVCLCKTYYMLIYCCFIVDSNFLNLKKSLIFSLCRIKIPQTILWRQVKLYNFYFKCQHLLNVLLIKLISPVSNA